MRRPRYMDASCYFNPRFPQYSGSGGRPLWDIRPFAGIRGRSPWLHPLTGSIALLLGGRAPGPPMHEGLHLFLRHLAVLVPIHRFENSLMSRLKLLQ
jgi:hypothetical protein